MPSKTRKRKTELRVYDRLTLMRELPDGRLYQGLQGARYMFIWQDSGNGKIGFVRINRSYMTGLFRPKYEEPGLLYCGDYQDQVLRFMEEPEGQIVILARPFEQTEDKRQPKA